MITDLEVTRSQESLLYGMNKRCLRTTCNQGARGQLRLFSCVVSSQQAQMIKPDASSPIISDVPMGAGYKPCVTWAGALNVVTTPSAAVYLHDSKL